MNPDYLFQRSGPPDPEVEAMERTLAPLRFDPASRPLTLARARRPRTALHVIAAAAAVVAVCGGAIAAWSAWRLKWDEGRAWTVRLNDSKSALPVSGSLDVPAGSVAAIDIARIGEMRAAAGTILSLAQTRSARHRITLDAGSISVRVWAPPGRFGIQTPAGEVIDLGCVFDLSVDGGGSTHLEVRTGWVQLANGFGEALVPAGATSTMTTSRRPTVPVYLDASPRLRDAIRSFEAAMADPAAAAALEGALPDARRRDVLTLLLLSRISPSAVARPLLDRAAALVPPPAGVSIDAVLAGDRDQFWTWYASLDLPPVKSWWRNWRDALPRFDARYGD